jgi:transposase-like protein
MSVKITNCNKCESTNIKEVNPENRKTSTLPMCKINCICNDCTNEFVISSWTEAGKRKGILY